MKIRQIWLVLVGVVLLAGAAQTQDSKLEQLDTWGLGRGWEGVGLLNIAGSSTCTGVMIRPDLVLTAAHCLFDNDSNKMIDPRRIEFRAGWRDGKAIARRMGKVSVIHSRYTSSPHLSGEKIRNDVALLQLASPIQSTHADPFRADGGIRTGNTVSVVSFGAGRNNAVSRQRSCEVLEAADGLVAMSCDVVPGSSGSPVFALRQGRQRIVSLVSSLGSVNGRQVSYGMDIKAPLAHVMADFQAGRGVFPQATVGARRLIVGSQRQAGGARFLKP